MKPERKTTTIPELLAAGSATIFYDIAHSMAETWLRASSSPAMFCSLAADFARDEIKGLEADIQARMRIVAEEMEEDATGISRSSWDIRCIIWGLDCDDRVIAWDESVDARFKEKWQPFDLAAWDRLFAQIHASMSPGLPHFERAEANIRWLAEVMPPGENQDTITACVKYFADWYRCFRDNLDETYVKSAPWS